MVLSRIQRELSELYDVDAGASVDRFVCDADTVEATVGLGECGRGEVLVVAEEEDGVALGLYVAPGALRALTDAGGDAWFEEDRFQAACLATEGVSHFVYLMFRAQYAHAVSQLELEVQAEVDKYATALMAGNGVGAIRERSRAMRERLFERVRFLDEGASESGQRYRMATRVAGRYALYLEERYLSTGDLDALLRDLRRFYRLGQMGKLQTVARQ